MKVGTDGVLLGAWPACGLRTAASSTSVQAPADRPDDGPARSRSADYGCRRGGGLSGPRKRPPRRRGAAGWRSCQCPVQEFAPDERFDLIVSNPPFFVDSLICPDEGRTTARHAVRLPFDQLRDAVVRLLAAEGRFAVILPTDEARRFTDVCRGFLALTRSTGVRTTPRRPVKRLLMEFAHENVSSGLRSDSPPVCSELVVGTGRTRAVHPRIPGLNP